MSMATMACRSAGWFRQKSSSFVVLQDTFIKVLCWASKTFLCIGTYPASTQSCNAKYTVLWQTVLEVKDGRIDSFERADSATAVSSGGYRNVAGK